ncbi:MAG: NUDIX hydrolase [Anaerolineales bacterium]|nr:NUDIX hydrolase [Anaerolineales bacterium]
MRSNDMTRSPKPLRPWKTLRRETLLKHGRFLTVENHTIRLPDGQVIDDWPWLIIPSAVIVLAQTAEGKYLCFRQTKYAVEGTTLAPVGGMLEPGEEPLAAARRELGEETGYAADEWIPLGSYKLDPNRGVADMHLFLARGARQVSAPESDDLEDQELLLLERDELAAALRGGEFKVVAWAAVIAMALERSS